MTDPLIAYAARASLNRLCKWRSVLPIWAHVDSYSLGQVLKGNPWPKEE